MRPFSARWSIACAGGAALCTIGDHLHATHGVLVYAHPTFADQAWWVPLLFFGAAAAVLGAAAQVERVAGARLTAAGVRTSGPSLAVDTVGFAAAYAFTSFAPPDHPWLTLGVLVAAFVVRIATAWRSVVAVAFALVVAVAGPAFEATWSALGFFHYLRPDLAGIPLWLPGIYLHAALLALSLARVARDPVAAASAA